ncbi:MAG: hypothetical protein JSR86_00035 [Proteobacteria bacterium]|nr:hypothetical protein [Pseudomonadota bacterium]
MAAIAFSHYLRPRHEGRVCTELGLSQTVALLDKGLPPGKGMYEQRGVWASRVGPGDRFQLEAIYASLQQLPPGFTTADVLADGAGTEIDCVSSFRKYNWIGPAIWVVGVMGLCIAIEVEEGFTDWRLVLLLGAGFAAGVLAWRGYERFRLARDHDYVLLYLALAVQGHRANPAPRRAPATVGESAA